MDVSSQLSGRIADVFVDFNDAVKAGQPLARLDQDMFVARVNETKAALAVARANVQVEQAAVERARAAVANAHIAQKIAASESASVQARQGEAEREFQRKAELVRTGTVSERDLGQARTLRDTGVADLRASVEQVELKSQAIAIADAELRMAEANARNAEAVVSQRQATLDQAESDLARTVLRAPIDGVIVKRDLNPGQTVAVSLDARTLFTIVNDLGAMTVHAKIDEADIGSLRVGQVAHFTVDAYPERTFTGGVTQIRKSPEVVQNVVTYTAIVSAPNPQLMLLPGMTATLQIVTSDTGDILKIPNQALHFQPAGAPPIAAGATTLSRSPTPNSALVWVLDKERRPARVAISIGRNDDSSTELVSGPLREAQPLIIGIANSGAGTRPWNIRLGF